MKIIFLNTWHGELRNELRAYVKQHIHSTAVFCFQEAHSDERQSYEDLLADDFTLHDAGRLFKANGSWYGNPIYVRNNIHIAETGGLFTDDTTDTLGLVSYVTLKIGGKKLTICNVHGIPYPGDKLDTAARLQQSEAIIKAFSNHEAVIIGGDFNLLPETKSIQLFNENKYQDLIADFEIQTTRNRIVFEKYANDILYHSDYVFVSPTLQVKDFIVPSEIVSDHQPLELSVDLSELRVLTYTGENNKAPILETL